MDEGEREWHQVGANLTRGLTLRQDDWRTRDERDGMIASLSPIARTKPNEAGGCGRDVTECVRMWENVR